MKSVLSLEDLDLEGKRVLIREDLNVPVKEGRITGDARIRAAMPTIESALNAGAKVMLMSHLGRPTEGVAIAEQPEFSMAPVAGYIGKLLGRSVPLIEDYLDGFELEGVDIVLFENVRINKGEKANDAALARKLAALCDIFVMDAFGTAHRAQATTEGVARYAPAACAGPLLAAELDALERAVANPAHPVVAIVGGSKVSTKLDVLDALSHKVDTLIVGGGIANTFLAARGYNVGKSLCEADFLDTARKLLEWVDIRLPVDVVVAKEMSEHAEAVTKPVADVTDDEMILDVGPASMEALAGVIREARTIIWNGPVGVFELAPFAGGTRQLAKEIAENDGFSIAGGGDTLAAIDEFGIDDRVSYISTGGGAFLEFVEGKTLPAVAALEARAAELD